MGMYTEIFVNTDFVENTPDYVINTIRDMCKKDPESEYLKDKPSRWSYTFNNGSYYTPYTECALLTYDNFSRRWSLLAKGDIKNYEHEIEKFFEFISPWCDSHFIGYMRHEECLEPTLMYSTLMEREQEW